MLRDFITEYWLYLTIVVGVIALMAMIYLTYIWYSGKKLRKYNRLHKNDIPSVDVEKKISLQDLIDQEIISTYESKSKDLVNPEENVLEPVSPNSAETVEMLVKTPLKSENEDSSQEPTSTKIDQTLTPSVEKNDTAIPERTEQTDTNESAFPDREMPETSIRHNKADNPSSSKAKRPLGKYHVLYRKEDHQWFVKREGSGRILRVLPTQKEAIAYATIKAITQNTGFVIHKQDGKIKKQD